MSFVVLSGVVDAKFGTVQDVDAPVPSYTVVVVPSYSATILTPVAVNFVVDGFVIVIVTDDCMFGDDGEKLKDE